VLNSHDRFASHIGRMNPAPFSRRLHGLAAGVLLMRAVPTGFPATPSINHSVSWVGNSFSSAGKEASCVTVAGDHAFTGGWKERGRIWVIRLSDGAEIGAFDPGPAVGGVERRMPVAPESHAGSMSARAALVIAVAAG
jgi:hypothetical protein